MQQAIDGVVAWESRARVPKPVAPYDSDISKAADNARDRETWEAVPRAWLRTYAEALRQYHIHPETKFLGGSQTEAGVLRRRHVFAVGVRTIGKEADNWEEDSHFGVGDDAAISYGLSPEDRERMAEVIREGLHRRDLRVKPLAKAASLSDHTVTRLMAGDASISNEDIERLHRAAEHLIAVRRALDDELADLLEWARAQPRSWLAAELDYDLSNLGKVLNGKLRPKRVMARIRALRK